MRPATPRHPAAGTPGIRPAAAVCAVLALALLLGGCTPGTGPSDAAGTAAPASTADPHAVVLKEPDPGPARLDATGSDAALQASRLYFDHAPAVVLVAVPNSGALPPAAAEAAARLGVPLLQAGPGDEAAPLAAEIERLGAEHVVAWGEPDGEWEPFTAGRSLVDGRAPDAQLPPTTPAPAPGQPPLVVVLDQDEDALAAASATAAAAGADVEVLASPDPREGANLALFQAAAGRPVLGLGPGLGAEEDFAALAETAATGPELPGGGQTVFPARRMVALYGHPETGALGLLGEQDAEAAVARVKKLAADYQPYSDEPVQPAFEIIATVASAGAGDDGTYSRYTPVETLRPWVEAAGKAGVYVVLDLQPGRNDFLSQARHYEELLKLPHVGIAYDPEWRLGPDQRHMVQIGSVSAAELNEANAWLAELTRKHRLPQKVVILHQFQLRMIRDRESLETGHPELSLVLHADGNGTPGQKLETWNALRRDLPGGIRMAWKNFIDEDSPTFSPEQTYDVEPKPWFVSYQ
ncbi:hypothetical protein ACQ3I4_01715 [Zafaria sp. Z1313]|uniref:hypothetical protein n=1 Tax=Zafaria sp. Z1313 TaxID=3423202 RepID=UPI003D302118